MLMSARKTKRMASDLTNFFGRYHKGGGDSLDYILPVTDGETWVLFVIVETKELSK
jgi:hypothetical protein